MPVGTDSVLMMEGITKAFPGVQALNHVDFALEKGEIHAILGENGAGKSTLIKILGGDYTKDEGRIIIKGKEVIIKNPRDAVKAGVRFIYQEANLVPNLSIAENVFLGNLPSRGKLRIVQKQNMWLATSQILDDLGVDLDPKRICSTLGAAEAQIIEIAKALSARCDILVMDEPTASLNLRETERLFSLIKGLRDKGVSVVYVSHRLYEIFELTDKVTVLRDGKRVATMPTSKLTHQSLVKMMVGRELKEMYPKRHFQLGEQILTVQGLRKLPLFEGVTFSVRRGEILGIYGLMGSGYNQIGEAIFGALGKVEGTVTVEGRVVKNGMPKYAKEAGVGFVPVDRKSEGLFLEMAVRPNITMANLRCYRRLGMIDQKRETKNALRMVDDFAIKTPTIEKKVLNLSGGNQQKVVLARWIESNAKVLILNEPTRGIDVGAKVEIYKLLEELCEKGLAVIVASSEAPELIGIADSILVVFQGKIVNQVTRQEASEELLLQYATGGSYA